MAVEQGLPPGVRTAIEFKTYEVPAELGVAMPPQAASCVLNITEDQFVAEVDRLRRETEQDARLMLARPGVAAALDRLPLPPGGLLMAVGDSVTAYRRSYADILSALLRLHRGADSHRFVNHAQSGYTSTHARRSTYLHFIQDQPDLVLLLLGGNDSERFGGPSAPPLVSVAEYRENIQVIVRAFRENTPAKILLLTPVPVIESMLRRVTGFSRSQLSWQNSDLLACADALRSVALQYSLPLVDLMEAFGAEPRPDLYFPDGIHPGPEGERLILDQLLQTVAWANF